MRFPVLLLVLATGVQLAVGQSANKQPPPKPGPLHSVVVRGNKLYSAEEIAKASGLQVGSVVSPEIIEAARKKLVGTELFINVADEFRFSRTAPPLYDVTFEVDEIQQLYPLRFERLNGKDAQQINAYLQEHVPLYLDRIPGTEGVLHRYAAAIQKFVSPDDPKFKVKGVVSNDDPKQLIALFSSAANAPIISQVFVTGNQAVDTGTILRAVNPTAVGVPLSDSRLHSILEGTIKPLYAAKGFAAVSFPKVDTEQAKGSTGVIVHVTIKDGPQFKFGPVRFRGQGMDEEEIRSNIPFRPGQVFNSEQVDAFRREMIRRMKRRGLLDARVSVDASPDDTNRTVAVAYNFTPGSLYTFRRLNIHGLDLHSEPVIQKLWGEKPGKPFNPEYPDFFLKKVEEQGLFDNLGQTAADYTPDSTSHDVTVDLYFKGGESIKEKIRKKEEERSKQTSDGTWSPYP